MNSDKYSDTHSDKIRKQMFRDPIFLDGADWHPMNKAMRKILKDVGGDRKK